MALGTTLSQVENISTTAGLYGINSISAGTAAIQEAVDSSGTLTLCLMGYHHDYSNNAPTQNGDHTQIRVYYMEQGGGYRPHIGVVEGLSVTEVYAESTGTDDDSYQQHFTLDGSVSWSTIRGDSTTTGNAYQANVGSSWSGVYTIKFTGRGSDVITSVVRSYFVFDLSVITGTVDAAKFNFYLDNVGHTNDDFGKVVVVQATALAGDTSDFGNCFVADTGTTTTHNATFFGTNF